MRRQLEPTHLIPARASLRRAVIQIDRNRCGAVCVVDDQDHLLGILTDGDIRRQVLRQVDLDQVRVEDVMQRRPVTATEDFSLAQLKHLMKARSIQQIPIVDHENRILGLSLAADLVVGPARGKKAVVMAGGRGVRLRPLTLERPKPLLPVGGRPLLELIIERMVACGFTDIIVTTAYRSRMIEDHLQDGSHLGATIRYLRETEPRGTAGSLSDLPPDDESDLLVMNGDILTTLEFNGLLDSHQAGGSDLTLAVREVEQHVDYGVVQTQDEWITRIDEKPRRSVLVNAGIYIVGPRARALVPGSGRFDMTELVRYSLGERLRVRSFPLREYWLDIGRMDDYERANRDLAEQMTFSREQDIHRHRPERAQV